MKKQNRELEGGERRRILLRDRHKISILTRTRSLLCFIIISSRNIIKTDKQLNIISEIIPNTSQNTYRPAFCAGHRRPVMATMLIHLVVVPCNS